MVPVIALLLGARLLVAGCHGLFFGIELVLAMRLAPKDRILKEAADAPNFASTLISTAFNLGIAIAAALGAAAINAGWGYGSLPLVDAGAELVALAFVIILALYGRRLAVAAANPF